MPVGIPREGRKGARCHQPAPGHAGAARRPRPTTARVGAPTARSTTRASRPHAVASSRRHPRPTQAHPGRARRAGRRPPGRPAPPASPGRTKSGTAGPSPPGPPAKKGSPKPSATDPLTTASDRSSRIDHRRHGAPDERARARRPTPARPAAPAGRSMRPAPSPRPPPRDTPGCRTAQARPSGTTTTWPMWPALPSRPLSSLPSSTMPAARPRSTRPWRCNRRTRPPRRPTPRRVPGPWRRCRRRWAGPVKAASRARRGKERHPAMFRGETSSPPGLIGPPHPAPQTTQVVPRAHRSPSTPSTSPARCLPQRLGVVRARRRPGWAASPVRGGSRRARRARRPSWCRRCRRRGRDLPRKDCYRGLDPDRAMHGATVSGAG